MIARSIYDRSQKPLGIASRRYLRLSTLCCILAFLVLGIGAVRSGHSKWTLDVNIPLAALAALLVFVSRRIRLFSKELYVFLLIACLEVPVQWVVYEHFGIRSAAVGVFTLAIMIIVASLLLQKDYGKYYWNVVNGLSLFASWCLIIQVVMYYLGVRLDKIPGLSDIFFKAWEFSDKYRPCGLFSEPSHMAEFTLLSLYYYLFVKVDTKKAVVIAAALILSTSGLGIIGAGMLFGLYVWNMNSVGRKRQIRKIVVFLAVILAAWFVLTWIQQSDHWLAERLLSGGTFAARTMRSFELFGRFDAFEKLLGIGIQNQEIYLNYYWITLPSDTLQEVRQNREFAQTLGYIMCTTGIMGLMAFLLAFIKLAIKYDYRIKCIVLLFLFVCFTCCIFSRYIFIVYVIMVFATVDMVIEPKQKSGIETVKTAENGKPLSTT